MGNPNVEVAAINNGLEFHQPIDPVDPAHPWKTRFGKLPGGTVSIFKSGTTNAADFYMEDGNSAGGSITLNNTGDVDFGVFVHPGTYRILIRDGKGRTIADLDNVTYSTQTPYITIPTHFQPGTNADDSVRIQYAFLDAKKGGRVDFGNLDYNLRRTVHVFDEGVVLQGTGTLIAQRGFDAGELAEFDSLEDGIYALTIHPLICLAGNRHTVQGLNFRCEIPLPHANRDAARYERGRKFVGVSSRRFGAADTAVSNTLENCRFEGFDYGVTLSGYCFGLVNCSFNANTTGVFLTGSARVVRIVGCHFSYNQGWGLKIRHCRHWPPSDAKWHWDNDKRYMLYSTFEPVAGNVNYAPYGTLNIRVEDSIFERNWSGGANINATGVVFDNCWFESNKEEGNPIPAQYHIKFEGEGDTRGGKHLIRNCMIQTKSADNKYAIVVERSGCHDRLVARENNLSGGNNSVLFDDVNGYGRNHLEDFEIIANGTSSEDEV